MPTFFILSIVYATNFFKPFFFEAVVTVNLTSLLVLTTLFISVSSSLPPTAYVKMIDVWLIFSQTIPFIEVLLHTFMDCMRTEGDRDINHHGKVRAVKSLKEAWPVVEEEGGEAGPSYEDMTQRDERELVEARKLFYDNAKLEEDMLAIGEFAGSLCPLLTSIIFVPAKKLIPLAIVTFSTLFWAYGLLHYNDII